MSIDGSAPRLTDSKARIAALTDHDRTLLVEAGAGSGKTALIAGRAALLVAAGTPPRDIVAITFTEAAAAELLQRIETMVRDLLSDEVPIELSEALPSGLTEVRKLHLRQGAEALDEITCTTIHGFCQQLIRPYPVETGLDPGASIIDPASADLAYQDLLEAWLSARFGRDRGAEGLGRIPPITDAGGEQDFLAALVLEAPDKTLSMVRETAQFLKLHRTARAPTPELDRAVFQRFVQAADEFAAWYRNCQVKEPDTGALVQDLLDVADVVRQADRRPLAGRFLKELLSHRRPSACKKGSAEFKQWRRKIKWRTAAAAFGGSAALGERLSAAGNAHYDVCSEAYMAFRSELEALGFVRFVEEFAPFRDLFRDYKRNAALLDFDDLLYQARDLLRDKEPVRKALARRYPRILVDEFQDTDPLQAEIIWRLAGEGGPNAPWYDRDLRPGALFAVGDPKQAIYRFRGADVNTYLLAKQALERRDPSSILDVTANFRTRSPILEYVNRHFTDMLDESQGQPGFTPLAATRSAGTETCVAAFDIDLDASDRNARGKPIAHRVRLKEAKVLVSVVEDLIGAYPIRDKDEEAPRPARAGDIALLAPAGTSLWIYERAMEESGIPITTQAGKGFFRRQEVQDLVAVVRVIADSRDTLALGALIRGPLVGLTEEEIADEIEALHVRAESADPDPGLPTGSAGRLRLWTDPESVANGVLRRTLEILQNLARKTRRRTPYQLLAEAVEELHVHSILKARHPRGAERALANVELVLEMARAYAGRGIEDFARALWQSWEEQATQAEGRPDAAADSVSLITMHSAKGLEWPIVIPINTTTRPRPAKGLLYGRHDDTIHIQNSNFTSWGYHEVRDEEESELGAERIRLWYVALTRARDLLLLPRQSQRIDNDWLGLIDVDLLSLPSIRVDREFEGTLRSEPVSSHNAQDVATWKREAATIHANQRQISWYRPSRHENPTEPDEEEAVFAGVGATFDTVPEEARRTAVQGGPVRGLILHKLMEEVLTGETGDDEVALRSRATELIAQLGLEEAADASAGPSSVELAASVGRTLQLPEVATLRPRLVPEFPVYASAVEGSSVSLTAGIADAVAIDGKGRIDVVVDWKSDVKPAGKQVAMYHRQIRDYLRATNARTGLIVFMSTGRVDRIVKGV